MTERFSLTREFDAPREAVWRAWTDPEALAQWYGPKGATCEMKKFDLRPGGVWLYRMTVGQHVMLAHAKFRTVEPPKRLVWEQSDADEHGNIVRSSMMENWPLVILTEVVLTDLAGRTRLDLTWSALDATEAEQAALRAAKDMIGGGWGSSFPRLDAWLAGGAPDTKGETE